jgi:hypothetical protein
MASTTTEVVAQEQQTNGNGLQKMRHSEVGHKSLLKTDDQTCTGEIKRSNSRRKEKNKKKPIFETQFEFTCCITPMMFFVA